MQKEIKTNVPCLRMYRQHHKTYFEVRRDINFGNKEGSGLMLEFRDHKIDTYTIYIDPIQHLNKDKKIEEDWEQAYVLSKTLSRLLATYIQLEINIQLASVLITLIVMLAHMGVNSVPTLEVRSLRVLKIREVKRRIVFPKQLWKPIILFSIFN